MATEKNPAAEDPLYTEIGGLHLNGYMICPNRHQYDVEIVVRLNWLEEGEPILSPRSLIPSRCPVCYA